MINAGLRKTYCTTKEETQISKNNEESIVSSPIKMMNSVDCLMTGSKMEDQVR